MPPKRRSSGPGTKTQQSTLAFHGALNKVTKAGTRAQSAKNLLAEKKTNDVKAEIAEIEGINPEIPEIGDIKPEPTEIEDVKPELAEIEDTKPDTADAAITEQTKQEVEAQKVESTPEEDRARRITEAAIKKYWAAKEKQRLAPRVHQKGLSVHEKVLREFDMSAHYGPCTGIARIKRWKRAHRLDLDPPIEVLAVILKEEETSEDKLSVQKSQVDELLNPSTVDIEA